MRVILIDDEPISLEVLEILLSDFDNIEIVGQYTKPMLAYKEIEKTKPQAAFIDIELGAISGLEIGELLLNKMNSLEIVFVTAYSQYAISAFEMNAIDYLLKPVGKARLAKTIERLMEKIDQAEDEGCQSEENTIYITSFGGLSISDSSGDAVHWRTKKTKELFAYLWVQDRSTVDKHKIITDVFPDKNYEQANTLLHTTIYQLRTTLKNIGHNEAILYINEGYKLVLKHQSDATLLSSILSQDEKGEKEAEMILNLYKGDFLNEGYSWAYAYQERFRNLVFDTLLNFSLTQLRKRDFSDIAIKVLEKLYEIDPFSEDAAALLIEYFGESGNTSKLKSFYKDYTVNLKADMDVDPPVKIESLYKSYFS
jgi:two-component system LytT family response regulator